jgi:hypothetical protein
VSSLDRIIAGAHALAKAGANFRDFEHEQHRLQLQLVTGSDQAVVILAAAAKIQPPNTGTAERTAIELAKAGFTAQQIDAALPTIFEATTSGRSPPPSLSAGPSCSRHGPTPSP